MKNFFPFILFSVLIFVACRKNEIIDYNPNLKLQFSTDSILFDTVFTDKGSTSRSLKVFNYNKNSIIISDIKLLGGSQSAFKININGVATDNLTNIKVQGNDSIYVFVKAFIDPTNSDSPFLVEDQLTFSLNGRTDTIPLIAYGQNAVYLKDAYFTQNTSLSKNKPYLFVNDAVVGANTTLNIEAGSRLYFHKNAKLYVAGSLQANGTLQDSITISSDRMERIYSDEAGQWGGVHLLRTSFDNQINYTTLKNAIVGIRVDSLSNNSNPKLLLTNSIIKNHEVAGVLGYTASITGINNLMYNCGQFLVIGLYGGDYRFYQNTLANYNYNFPRRSPSVYFSDNLEDQSASSKALQAIFVNNIIYGSLIREVDFNQIGTNPYTVNFEDNLIRSDVQTLGNSNIYNQDPLFLDSRKEIYQLPNNSPAMGKGQDLSGNSYFNIYLMKDLVGKARTFPSTLGCYQ
ncbi:MAG: hypothetical protein IE931_00655 [Sphingobacteriales bacterium]|nr:hypothetical protein [Sphingobacteriales bacterium]